MDIVQSKLVNEGQQFAYQSKQEKPQPTTV